MRAPPTAARGKIPYPRRFGEPPQRDGEASLAAVSPTSMRAVTARALNTDPAGKQRHILRLGADVAGGHKARIPTSWGKNTDPAGKRCDLGGRIRAPRPPLQAVELPLDTKDWQCGGRGKPSPAFTDPRGKEYRPCRERIPTLWGDTYRPSGENLPIPPGYFTDPAGVLYRPHGETQRPNYLQTRHFCFFRSVYMVFCLCLMFCLINREGLGG